MRDDVIVGRDSVPGFADFIQVHFQFHPPVILFITDWLDWGCTLGAHVASDFIVRCERQHQVTLALMQSYRYLRFKPRTEWEVRMALRRKQIDNDIIDAAILVLKDKHVIDDRQYAQFVVRGRLNATSRQSIGYKLQTKGIPKHVADEVLFEEFSIEDEQNNAVRIAEKYVRQKGISDTKQMMMKCGAYLQRKGFSHDVIRRTLQLLTSTSSVYARDGDEFL